MGVPQNWPVYSKKNPTLLFWETSISCLPSCCHLTCRWWILNLNKTETIDVPKSFPQHNPKHGNPAVNSRKIWALPIFSGNQSSNPWLMAESTLIFGDNTLLEESLTHQWFTIGFHCHFLTRSFAQTWQPWTSSIHTHDGSVCMPYMVTFTINIPHSC